MNCCYKIQILSSGKFLDMLPETTIVPIKNLEELTEIETIKIGAAYSTTIPVTPHNKRFLESSIGKQSKNPIKVRVWKDYKVLDQDTLYVTSKSADGCSYSVRITYGGKHWAQIASDCPLCDVFTDDDTFDVSKQAILDNWQTPGNVWDNGDPIYLFPPVDYGDFYNESKGIIPEDLRPWFSLPAILHRGFQKIGWCLKSPILETLMFRSLWIYILSKDYNSKEENTRDCNVQLLSDAILDWNTLAYHPDYGNESVQLSGQYLFPAILNYGNYGSLNVIQGITPLDFVQPLASRHAASATAVFKAAEYCVCLKGTIEVSGKIGTKDGIAEIYINLHYYDTTTNTNSLFVLGTQSFIVNHTLVNSGGTDVIEVDFCFPDIIPNLTGRQIFFTYGINNLGSIDAAIELNPKIDYNLTYEFRAKRVLFGEGATWNFKDVVDCDKSFLDLVKGFVHLVNGKIETDFSTQTVCIRPPKTVTVSGEEVEGFYLDESIDLRQLMSCDSTGIKSPDYNLKRCLNLGYSKNNDPTLETLRPNDQGAEWLDTIIDRGEEFNSGKCDESRNPFFAPVTNRTNTFSNVAIPTALDNNQDERSYDLGCRIMIVAPSNS